ncbi:MAG TPA: hypothetical protein VL334_03250 [Anaerolineae bacterium]|nr:hypothetical protein [Anaerolineae bacterium]
MATSDVLAPIRYVVDANGEKTDVVIPVTTWQKMLMSWKEVVEMQDDKEDSAILQDWLQRRAAGAVETVSLDEMEREMVADGLLPG